MITVRPLTPADFTFGMELKTESGWNQLESDWRRAYELEPSGGFVGLSDGVPAATLTTCVFGRVAWIAMVLTRSEFRGRGLATALLRHSLAELERRGVESVRLDATALGRPVYEKLGFTVDGEITRYFGRPKPSPATQPEDDLLIHPFENEHLEQAARLDAEATGNDRTRLLQAVYRDWPVAGLVAIRNRVVIGFSLARQGSRAPQIGPTIAIDPAAGARLLIDRFRNLGNSEIFLDVPHGNLAARELALASRLVAERDFFRMTRGKTVAEKSEWVWANCGPEKG